MAIQSTPMTYPYVSPFKLRRAVETLRAGGVIAYPTEAVYGLGCDPFNAEAIMRLLALKQRSVDKGLILVAEDFAQLAPLLSPLPADRHRAVMRTWPGPNTWVWPARPEVPVLLTGCFDSLAVRVSDHPLVRRLCAAFHGPIVSTSANPAGRPPARRARDVRRYFDAELDFLLPGPCGGRARPTAIRDALTGSAIRAA